MSQSLSKSIRTFLIFFIVALISESAFGFKIKTHAYVGHQVLESIARCTKIEGHYCMYLNLTNGESQTVNLSKKVAEALLNNRETFVLGNFGPDAFPDIVAGQSVIHPGIADGNKMSFGTGDWIQKILSKAEHPKELAIAYGFASHAATDVFAHTYVNQYSGGVFDLSDGETEVEERHGLLESLISKYTPQVNNNTYKYLYGDSKLDIPSNFIYRTFYADNDSRREFKKSSSSSHIVFFEDIKREFDRALKTKDIGGVKFDIDRIRELMNSTGSSTYSFKEFVNEYNNKLKGAGIVQQIEIYLMQIIAAEYMGVKLTAAEAEALAKVATKIHDYSNDTSMGGIKKINKLKSQLKALENKATSKTLKYIEDLNAKLDGPKKLLGKINKSKKSLRGIKSKIDKLLIESGEGVYRECKRSLNKLPSKVVKKYACEKIKVITKYHDKICQKLGPPYPCGSVWKPKVCRANVDFVCGQIKKTHRKAYNATCKKKIPNPERAVVKAHCDSIKLSIDTAELALKKKRKEFDKLNDEIESKVAKLGRAHRRAIKLAKEAIKFKKGIDAKVHSLENEVPKHIRRWSHSLRKLVESQRSDVILAIEKYIEANTLSMTNSTNTEWWEKGIIRDANSKLMAPLKEWLLCYGPVLTAGVPIINGDMACNLMSTVGDINDKVGELNDQLIKIIPYKKGNLLDLKEEMIEKGPSVVMEKGQMLLSELSKVLGVDSPIDIQRLHNGFSFNGDEKHVHHHFAHTHNPSLIAYSSSDSIVSRVKSDMRLGSKSYFDPQEFPVIANAIQLAKLSLLDANQLNAVARDLGYKGNERLYSSEKNNHILTHWLRSIDGNHQWLPLAPPKLVNVGFIDEEWDESASFLQDLNSNLNPSPTLTALSRVFSYPKGYRESGGMRFYLNEEAREKVFSQLFSGPLNQSLYLNDEFSNVVPADYIYNPSWDEPFPNLEL